MRVIPCDTGQIWPAGERVCASNLQGKTARGCFAALDSGLASRLYGKLCLAAVLLGLFQRPKIAGA